MRGIMLPSGIRRKGASKTIETLISLRLSWVVQVVRSKEQSGGCANAKCEAAQAIRVSKFGKLS